MIPASLAQLYPAGTPLAEVKPDFRGKPLRRWRLLDVTRQCEDWLGSSECRARPTPAWAEKPLSTPKSAYGMKGMLGDSRPPGAKGSGV